MLVGMTMKDGCLAILLLAQCCRAMMLTDSRRGSAGGQREASSSCVPLRNHGQYYTVEVGVGTPLQKFDVIADTGSNALIVPSCACRRKRNCFPDSKCFVGPGKSSSFSVDIVRDHVLKTVEMHFGSGDIRAAVSTDVAQVGKISALMNHSLMLMVDHKLAVEGTFEGLLGLGLPQYGRHIEEMPPSFLEMAKVQRFSYCINGNGDGALRLGVAEASEPLRSTGQVHWGLDFYGVSVGSRSTDVKFCRPEDMKKGQRSPCGAVPDSGTTLLMAPREHVAALLEALCDDWKPCSQAAARSREQPKAMLVQQLLMDCASWQEGSSPPSLYFHVADDEGKKAVVEVPSSAYVMTVDSSQLVEFLGNSSLAGFSFHTQIPGGQKICVPAFGELDYQTEVNGPVWILGLPLFRQNVVTYDLNAQQQPTIAFQSAPCAGCGAHGVSFDVEQGVEAGAFRFQDLTGPPRKPAFSVMRSHAM
eukprot:TRINITY_DN27098_c0_g1_i1.p1 TRINITY_DN27098_c0_g1~~TRINITY_DN27098_c0_g1_i1.p1  ORF type:complete len:474 (-),score=74.65 TRINITY_DN27098_c0_g1_i1:83-1504(-)